MQGRRDRGTGDGARGGSGELSRRRARREGRHDRADDPVLRRGRPPRLGEAARGRHPRVRRRRRPPPQVHPQAQGPRLVAPGDDRAREHLSAEAEQPRGPPADHRAPRCAPRDRRRPHRRAAGASRRDPQLPRTPRRSPARGRSMSETSVILGAARTPIGAFLGGLAPLTAPQLGAIAIKCAVQRSGVAPENIEEVFMGSVIQAGVGQAPARQASLGAGLARSIPCTTINKVCGSGLKAVMLASSQIAAGEYGVIVAGGMESMSNAPYLLRGRRQGLPLGEHTMADANLTDGLVDAYGGGHMGLGGEKAAAMAGLTREDQDRFALRSYEKALAAQRSGAFDAEIVPVEVKGRKGQVTRVERDESPRETSLEALAALKPAFKPDGTVTAGNAPKLNA